MRIRVMVTAGCLLLTLAAAVGPAPVEGAPMTSQTIIEPVASDAGDELVANTVAFQSSGGPALIQWSLSYAAEKATVGQKRGINTIARLDLKARLLRGDEPLVEWQLNFAETLQRIDTPVGVTLKGIASALYIDQPPPGPQVYRLVVWDADQRVEQGRTWLQISARTLLVEPR